jgi:hypothetical protein
MTADSCIRLRRGREYDLRPLIKELSVDHAPPQHDIPLPTTAFCGEEPSAGDTCGGAPSPTPRLTADASVVGVESDQLLQMVLEAGDRGTARPDEVLLALNVDPSMADIHRRHIRFAFDN